MKLTVRTDSRYFGSHVYSIDVPEPVEYAFEPIKTNDDNMLCHIMGENPAESIGVRRKLKIREDAARSLAHEITGILLAEMSKNDTHNGYKVSAGE